MTEKLNMDAIIDTVKKAPLFQKYLNIHERIPKNYLGANSNCAMYRSHDEQNFITIVVNEEKLGLFLNICDLSVGTDSAIKTEFSQLEKEVKKLPNIYDLGFKPYRF